jgi:hypothetical protein
MDGNQGKQKATALDYKLGDPEIGEAKTYRILEYVLDGPEGGTSTSSSRPTPVRVDSIPGAFSVGHPVTAPPTTVPTPTATEEVLPEENGLVNAEPVPEIPFFDGEAEPVDAQEFERKKTQRRKQNALFACAAVSLLAVAVAVVVGLVVGTSPSNTTTTAVAPLVQTQAPTTITDAIYHRITDLLPQQQHTKNSPQALAIDWILQDPLVFQYPDWRILQRYALATLYYATQGQSWTDSTQWLTYDTHECEWYTQYSFAMKHSLAKIFPGYLQEFDDTPHPPTTCNGLGLYQHLWLDSNQLQGTFPTEIFLLTTLQTLSLGFNKLTGTIPTELALMTDIYGLGLMYLANAGTLPSEIGLLTNIRMLGLNGCNLQGTLPPEFWNLTSLQTVVLSQNPSLAGTIPTEIGLFSNLRWFGWEYGSLTGALPSEIARIQTLEWLVVPQHKLQGTIPTHLALLPNLLQLAIHTNQITGTLPTQLGLLTRCTSLGVHHNLLSGTIPSECGLLTNLTLGLWIGNTLTTGTIPSELGRLTNMYEL